VNPFSDDFDPVVVEPYEQVDPAAIDSLVPLLSADDASLRESAAGVIGTLRGSSALPTIQSRLEEEKENDVTLALIRAVILIGDREAAESLIPLTRSSETEVRALAIYGLGRLRVKEAVPQLTELYSSGIEERRRVLGIPVSSVNEFQRNVFQSLSLIGDSESKGLFMDGLGNEDAFYRRFSAEGLGRIGDTSVTTDVARMRIPEKSSEVKLATGFALFLLGREEHLDELVAAADSGQAKHYLMELGESDIAKLFAYLDSSKPSIQIALLEVIGLRGGRDAIEVAEKATSSADANVASAANQAVRRLNGRHP
jgi:HEAT repeat protein